MQSSPNSYIKRMFRLRINEGSNLEYHGVWTGNIDNPMILIDETMRKVYHFSFPAGVAKTTKEDHHHGTGSDSSEGKASVRAG